MSADDLTPRLLDARQDRTGTRTDEEFEALLKGVALASGLDHDWRPEDGEEWARFIDADGGKAVILIHRHVDLCFVATGHESSLAKCDQGQSLDIVAVEDFDQGRFRASLDSLRAFCGPHATGAIADGVVDPDHFSVLDLWYLCP
jgi:hypothetical protein